MSRSWKHNPVLKDNDKWFKRYVNKQYRKRSIDLTDVSIGRYTDSYNICDFMYTYFDSKFLNIPAYKLFMK